MCEIIYKDFFKLKVIMIRIKLNIYKKYISEINFPFQLYFKFSRYESSV